MKHKGFLYIFILIFLVSCEPNIGEDFDYSSGKADFSTYVAMGNSLTAGFADKALYKSGQEYSYANILAQQFKTVGGGDFKQPMMDTEDGVYPNAIPGGVFYTTKYHLALIPDTDCEGTPIGTYSLKPDLINPETSQATLSEQLNTPIGAAGPYNNMGVPGAQVQHLLFDQYGNPTALGMNNPFFVRFASSPTTTVLADAMAQNPSFFSLWIGNNDVLTSASAGTDTLITPLAVFSGSYHVILENMFGANSNLKGVLANIPDIHDIPYFTTVSKALPYNGLVLTAEQAAGLTLIYATYGHPEITFAEGPNAFVKLNPDGSFGRTEDGDLFLLTMPTKDILCKGLGSVDMSTVPPTLNPMLDGQILDKNEQATTGSAIAEYNSTIAQFAQDYDMAMVDFNTIFKDFASGMKFDGISYSTVFVQGGVFSLDGIHLTPQANAITANYFIDAINAKYDANIPKAVVSEFPGILFP
jgi:hypothetical protein